MHDDSNDFQILVQHPNGYIGMCTCCKEYNFVYKNIFLSFTKEDLFEFCSWLIEYQNDAEHIFPLAHGRNRVFQSPLNNMSLVFSIEELKEIDEMFIQIKLLADAKEMLLN